MVPLKNDDTTTLSAEQKSKVLAETNKLSKNFKKAFDSVLQGNFNDHVATLVDYLNYLDSHISRPFREYNDCQEALKQCYSATANVYHPKSSKKDGKDTG